TAGLSSSLLTILYIYSSFIAFRNEMTYCIRKYITTMSPGNKAELSMILGDGAVCRRISRAEAGKNRRNNESADKILQEYIDTW
ncbi:MAG: hypothetical protein IJK25_09725, partial [Firmicutes bacterium]|nr:hypothetical protein [Bacillota bacterium]